jgi:hypothetical protein
MDERYYTSLQSRFRQLNQVEDFCQRYFQSAPLTIGMHIRAGNNETGHFEKKNRRIDNTTEWLSNVARHIQSLLQYRHPNTTHHDKSPVLYIATDTPSFFQRIESMFSNESLLVLQYPNVRQRKEGEGVVFGAQDSIKPQNEECLDAWESTFADMFILSNVDILVAPRTSSFSQGLPMSLVFAKRLLNEKALGQSITSLPPAFCEMDRPALAMNCYNTYMDWCCNGTTDQRDTVLFPNKRFYTSDKNWVQINSRDGNCDVTAGLIPDTCLPLRWKY